MGVEFRMFEFYWPYFAILLPLPLLVLWFFPKINNDENPNKHSLLFPNLSNIQKAFDKEASEKAAGSNIYLLLLILFWIFLILALMRPQIIDQTQEIHEKGHDILLAVDISPSMNALDFSTPEKNITRLDITKTVIKNFIAKRTTDRLGLILFGEHAYVQVPLTHDTNQVATMLDNAAAGMAGMSTAIGDTIGVAIKNLRNRNEKNRILILLTDGDDNSSIIPPDEAAEIARNNGIKIYTIGIGKAGLVPFPDEYGKIHMVEIGMDEVLLQKIATITGGSYFKAEDDITLEKIYQKIDQLEKIQYDLRTFQISTPLFRYPLGLASFIFLILALAALLSNVNINARGKHGKI